MDTKSLSKFLVKAKIATYASESEGNKKKLEDGATELTYEKDNLIYRDRYYGSHAFIGEEIIFEGSKKMWGMNYYGILLDDAVPVDEFIDFLKKSMRQVSVDRPFRGPESYKADEFSYKDKSEGSIGSFRGIETISYRNKKIYCLYYHGGFIKDF